MACLNCGERKTIRAHLIPRSFAREVQVGKAHAVVRVNGEILKLTQSGIFDTDILCGPCDNHLGSYESYALKALRRVRKAATGFPSDKVLTVTDIDGDKMVRFCAAILWKYSVTSRRNGRIELGPYQGTLKSVIFDNAPIPTQIDAFAFRLVRDSKDDGVFSYRTPRPDRKEGINVFRLMVGGTLFFIRVDKRSLENRVLAPLWLRGQSSMSVLVAPAQFFEEYKSGQKLAHSDSKLSRFLEKQDGS